MKLILKLLLNIKFYFLLGDKEGSKIKAIELVKKHKINTFYDVNRFIQNKMTYKMDYLFGLVDTMHDLNYTKERNWKGDCDDYAMVAYRLLEALDYRPRILHLITTNPKTWHTVCLFKGGDYFYVIGTEGIHKHDKIKEVLNYHADYFGNKVITYDIRKI